MTAFKDLVAILLLVLLLPVGMALGLGVLGVIVIRQLYWWARGNTTVVSRSAGVRSSPYHRASNGGTPPALTRAPLAAVTVASLADATAAGALSPAVPGVSLR